MTKHPKSAKAATAAVASRPLHLSCLSKSSQMYSTNDGCQIDVWELTVSQTGALLSEWAKAFRQHYCSDSDIDALRSGTGLTRSEYLIQLVFPDISAPPGPGIRSGDFAELLVSDYVEHVLGYWVPRGKFAEKASRNESVKGVDILGFRFNNSTTPNPTDTLLAFEVKAQLSGSKYKGGLQKAIDDSSKDYLRRAMTLNATKRRLLTSGQNVEALWVERFQNISDRPYVYRSGAAALLSDAAHDATALQTSTNVGKHQNAGNIELIVIWGSDLMKLVHELYERAADEA